MVAYDHVRNQAFYNITCVPAANFLRCDGNHTWWMAPFPPDAMIIKTFWVEHSKLPASADPADYYSYDPPGESTQYLAGMHLNTKDAEDAEWLWATFWVPAPGGDVATKGGDDLADFYHFAGVAGQY